MTREEAIETSIKAGSRVLSRLRLQRPEWLCDVLEREAAEDFIDTLAAFGLLKFDSE